MLTSSPARVWEVCSTTGEKVAGIAALPSAVFLELCSCPLLHQLGGCKGRGTEGKELCKLRKFHYYPAMSEIFKWWGKRKTFLEIECYETRIEHTGSAPSSGFSVKKKKGEEVPL